MKKSNGDVKKILEGICLEFDGSSDLEISSVKDGITPEVNVDISHPIGDFNHIPINIKVHVYNSQHGGISKKKFIYGERENSKKGIFTAHVFVKYGKTNFYAPINRIDSKLEKGSLSKYVDCDARNMIRLKDLENLALNYSKNQLTYFDFFENQLKRFEAEHMVRSGDNEIPMDRGGTAYRFVKTKLLNDIDQKETTFIIGREDRNRLVLVPKYFLKDRKRIDLPVRYNHDGSWNSIGNISISDQGNLFFKE